SSSAASAPSSLNGSVCISTTPQVFPETSIQKNVLKMPSHASDPAARPPSTARLLIPNPHPNLSGEPGKRTGFLLNCGIVLLNSPQILPPSLVAPLLPTLPPPKTPLAANHPPVQHHPLELQVTPRRRVEAAAAAEELHRLHRLRRRFYKTPIRLPQLKRHHPRLLFRRNVEERVRHPQWLEDVPPKIFLQCLPAHPFHQFSPPLRADSLFPVPSGIEHERRLQKRVATPRNRGSQSRLHVLVQPHIEKVVAKPRSVRQQLPHCRRRLRWPQLRLFRRRIEFLEHLHLRQF